ncbi:LysM peptidoglycan-binding domain-containing protein [Streptomyces sp. NPDC096934]|uniref:LysM peptidoglycan-binding domain-containing protein n=1 Tax=Streptomyces sp. NPDC096934 TaxID=3155551 RepID=UPI0033180DB8
MTKPTALPARLFKAAASLLLLLAAVAGLPLLLTWATPAIWAASHDDLAHLLDRQDTGSVFLLVLVAVGWAGWAQFTFCALRELAAQLRGHRWHPPSGLGASQRAAALLIGSILVLLPAGSALASNAHAATAATATRIPGHALAGPHAARPEKATQVSATDSVASYTVREVRPAESLWSIAERELGDGERWQEIADLNEGHTMADGHVFRSNSFLQPGWTLSMPDDARREGLRTQTSGQTADAESSGRSVTVRSGDSLSEIAEAELGDGSAWPALFDASKDKPQPDGLPAITDPDLIYAGQHVTVPSTPPANADKGEANAGSPPPSASPAPRTPTSTPTSRPSQDDEKTAGHDSAPAPELPAPARPTAGPSPDQTTAPSPAPTLDDAEPAAPGSVLNLRTVLGAGALLAAAVTTALAMRRTLQLSRRKPGETIAISAEPSPAEAQLAAAAEPSGAARLDSALRSVAHAAERDGRDVPLLRAARLDAHRIHVLPDDLASEPQHPFAAGAAGWWQLHEDAELLDEDKARTIPAPQPALVTIGTTEAGDLILADLARLPALLLDGNPVHITEVCTSLTLELGMSPWGHDAEIVAVGFGEDLPNLLPTSRIAHMRQPDHALRDLTERLLEVHQMPETAHHPYIVLCVSPLNDDTAWQFADLLGKDLPIPATLIAPAATAARHFPEAEILAVSTSSPQRLDSIGVDVIVQRLEDAAYQQIVTALAVSGQPAHEAEGAWRHVPGEPTVTDEAAPSRAVLAADSPASAETSADDVGEGAADAVFPALLQASTDPAALPLAATSSATGPNTEGATTAGPDIAAEPHASTVSSPSSPADSRDRTMQGLGPEIRVLGTVEVDGLGPNGHGPRTAQLAALLYFRPGRTAGTLCADMDPLKPWSTTTLNARLQNLRRALGNDPDGDPYVPRRRNGDTPYRLADGVRCDWTHFLQLAERALPQGESGLTDLEEALSLVRGRPFGSHAPAWAAPHQQEMITRIIDVAHTVAIHRTKPGQHQDLVGARRAIVLGLDVDASAELLYRDWLIVERAAGNRAGMHTTIARVQQVAQALDFDLEPETQQLIQELFPSSRKAATR